MSASNTADAPGATVVDALAARPGGRELLELGEQREDLALVGGAVRDLLRGAVPRELDVTVDGSAAELAAELARMLATQGASLPETALHDRFGTAVLEWEQGRIDVAARRAESYPRPGALPEVRPADAREDLARRDFTVNAMAVPLGGPQRGRLQAVEHALEDLAAARLRVLHERSFIEDPTRLLRLGRYRARLRFEVETHTAGLAQAALAAGALATVSGARVGAELRLAVDEGAAAALSSLSELGVLGGLALPSPFDEQLLLAAGELMTPDASPRVLAMAVLLHPPQGSHAAARARAEELLRSFELLAEERERVLAGAFGAETLAAEIEGATRPSQLRRVLAAAPVEAVALAGALGSARAPEIPERARAWLSQLRGVRLQIGGADLLAAGLPEGPDIGRRLARVLDLRLDGELADGRAAELRAALEAPA